MNSKKKYPAKGMGNSFYTDGNLNIVKKTRAGWQRLADKLARKAQPKGKWVGVVCEGFYGEYYVVNVAGECKK